MKSHAQIVIVGGGVIGASVAYHLTKLGLTDVLLIERAELTAGSTWHAAGGFHTLNGDTNMCALQGYTIGLYKELEEITGVSCGLHHVGGVTLAGDRDRLDMLVAERAKHRHMGLDTHILTPDEIAQVAPIVNLDGVLGALYDPLDGHLDPYGTTHAYAKAARMGGAEIVQHTMVTGFERRGDEWCVRTDKGDVTCQHVVNAAGLWAREVAAMAGHHAPLHPMEHQYLITDDVPEIVERDTEHPHVMDPAGESYLRQEGRGLCIGFYEQHARPWAVDGTPWEFGQELLADDFDKIEDSVAFAYDRFPALARAGVKRVIHGPFTFAPDGNPLVGPVPGVPGWWSACGVMAGFSQGGGVGLTLAQWIVEGEPDRDVTAMDVARYGDWAGPGYVRPKVIENYQRRFSVTYPNEELPAARPLRTTPMYDIFTAQGAVWGQQFGLEVPNYFAQGDEPTYESPSFRRSDAHDAVGREVRAVRSGAGINELANFGKYRVTGPNAAAWVRRVMAGRLPKVGRLTLSPMLAPSGRLLGDFTISQPAEGTFHLTASYGAQGQHMRWFEAQAMEGVRVENVSDTLTGFTVAGPKARDILQACTRQPVDLRFLDVRPMVLGMTDCTVQRVSYTGDLGYEVYCHAMDQRALHATLSEAGAAHGLTPFGMRAMMSLRLDRFFGSWGAEFSPDYTAAETGMDRFIDWTRDDYIGAEAARAERETPPARLLTSLLIDAEDADAHGYEPVFDGEAVAGFVTSGGYSHHAGQSVAMAMLPRDTDPGATLTVEIMGQRRPARIAETADLMGADGARMRA
ncbi:MAG: GcvT family protein [Paracoccaceae bacterium]